MKTPLVRKLLCGALCCALVAATICASGCNNESTSQNSTTTPEVAQTSAVVDGVFEDGAKLGEGAVQFTFTVVDTQGAQTSATVSTDAQTLGQALLDLGVIAGEDSEYGLYVKTVNGTTLDYDKDGKYWALYVDDQYATAGVDSTPIEAGKTYSFKAE